VSEASYVLSEAQLAGWVKAQAVPQGARILLTGDLGAGKSTLARVFLRDWSTETDVGGSPTFSIAHEYQTGRGRVLHLDLYRLDDAEEFFETGLWDELMSGQATYFIEWVDRVPSLRADLKRSAGAGEFALIEIQIESVQGGRRYEVSVG
jgi:tRNA threonylcarbamoyladenosine biosynthesis protein TsaE